MDIKDVRLKKGMSRDEVNKEISEWLLLEDKIYMGNAYFHNWICKCGNVIKRSWDKVRSRASIRCKKCVRNKVESRYKYEVEKNNEYEYIRAFLKGDTLPDKRVVNKGAYMMIVHNYCGTSSVVKSSGFINENIRCGKCCQKYENSFAYHIEVELGLSINDVWDFDKNMASPYHISRGSGNKVWLKCQEKDYHGSYEIKCNEYLDGHRCVYCGNYKTHPQDSFAQYHIDNTDKDFLEKYWDYEKNILDPWEISKCSAKKVWIKCQNEEVNELNGRKKMDYHGSYEISCDSFIRGRRCNNCAGKSVHIYDSFGYENINLADRFVDKNISSFKISSKSGLEYKFLCEECGLIFSKRIADISLKNSWCPECSMSEGERLISAWLRYNNIEYEYEKEFDGLVGVNNGNLSYDFYLQEYNTLIEFQGGQHEKRIKLFHETEDDFKIQLEHDRRKREYAKICNIKFIEIFEKDKYNTEEILEEELINGNKPV